MAVVMVDSELTPDYLQAQLRTKIASFAVPSRWRLQREPLLTNSAGKVDKAALSAQVRAELLSGRA
jgi:acyl-CoA synthetase (AMP-forming)/AMP-acid ligase II